MLLRLSEFEVELSISDPLNYDTETLDVIIQVLAITMQQEIEQKYSYLDEFKIVRSLGSGYQAQVKLAEGKDGNLYAIKRYKKETATIKTLEHQLSVMRVLHHENLVRLYDVRPYATYKKKDQTSYKCFAIILEYVGGGELFDFVAETGKFSQKVTRTYFHQMMNGLYYMHCKGYAHRDIKPENILLTSDFTLKLADFGFACPLRGKDGNGVLRTKLGTEGYMAPQIPSKNYRGKQSDIFAAGVILFIMYAGNPPFEKSCPSDPYYRLIKQKNYSVFWKAHTRNKSHFFFSQSFKDLFMKMVAFEPHQRPTIEQIANHPWVKGQVCTVSQIKQEFVLRQKRLEMIMSKKRKDEEVQKTNKKEIAHVEKTENIQPVETLLMLYEKELGTSRQFTQFKQMKNCHFLVSESLSYVVASLKHFFMNKVIKFTQQVDFIRNQVQLTVIRLQDQGNSLRTTYEYKIGEPEETYIDYVEIQVQPGKNQNGETVVSLSHQGGSQLGYKIVTKEIRRLFLSCH